MSSKPRFYQERAVRRMMRTLRRRGLFDLEHGIDKDDEPEAALCASAVSGREPPAGPQWLRGLSPLSPSALAYDKPLCASLDGFTLHAATRASAHRAAAREALLRRTFATDVLECPACKGRMKLVAMSTEPSSIARFLTALGEPTDAPGRSPNRGPPYCKSTVLRRKALGDAA